MWLDQCNLHSSSMDEYKVDIDCHPSAEHYSWTAGDAEGISHQKMIAGGIFGAVHHVNFYSCILPN